MLERFLVVDEVDANILFFEILLNSLGVKKILKAENANVALDMVNKEKIQFIVSAWEMNVMPGTIFVQRVKADKKYHHVPFLLYSKRLSNDDLQLTKDLGMNNVLGMPFDKEKAKNLIQTLSDAEEHLSNEEKQLRKIESYILEGKPTEALKFVDYKVTKKGSHYPRAKVLIAEIWTQTNKLDKAEHELKEALDYEPSNVTAKTALANLYTRQGKHQEAIDLLKKMAETSPKNVMTQINLGSAYVDADRLEDAKAIFEKVKKLDDDNPDLRDEQGKLAFKEGKFDVAAELLAQTKNGDILARHFNNQAIGLVNNGKLDEGITVYSNAMKLLNTKAKLYLLKYNLALALRKKGSLKESFNLLAESYISEPSFEKGYASLSRVAKEFKEKSGSLDQAIVSKVKAAREKYKAEHPDPAKDDKEKESA